MMMTDFMFYICVVSLALPPITAIVVGIIETIKDLKRRKQNGMDN